MNIGIIGDAHFRDALGYADYISDRREGERKQILDFIVDQFQDCDNVVFMGDNFDKPNPPSHVVRAFTEFVERFNGKQVYILAGNHEKTADGKSAIDYLKEISNPNWHIVTREITKIGQMVFCPYFFRQELGVNSYEEATNKLLLDLENILAGDSNDANYLFVHHAISDTLTPNGQNTSLFPEVVFPKEKLKNLFTWVVGGHIHRPQTQDNLIVTGSIFCNEAGDRDKAIWKITDTGLKKILLPGRGIYNLTLNKWTATAIGSLENVPKNSIVKVTLTDPTLPITEIKTFFSQFDVCILLEKFPDERTKVDLGKGAMIEFTIENLLGLYAEAKGVDKKKLLAGWELIQ